MESLKDCDNKVADARILSFAYYESAPLNSVLDGTNLVRNYCLGNNLLSKSWQPHVEFMYLVWSVKLDARIQQKESFGAGCLSPDIEAGTLHTPFSLLTHPTATTRWFGFQLLESDVKMRKMFCSIQLAPLHQSSCLHCVCFTLKLYCFALEILLCTPYIYHILYI